MSSLSYIGYPLSIFPLQVAQAVHLRMKEEMEYKWVKFLAKEFCPLAYAKGATKLRYISSNDADVIQSNRLEFIKTYQMTETMLAIIKQVEDKRRNHAYYLSVM